MVKYGALIPIRLASERLPNKAIKEICGKPIVCHLLDRVFESKYITSKKQVVVCTTREKSDDPLVKIVQEYGASVFRGSTDDIIKRFYDAILEFGFDAVIQVDGDDPLCDPQYMDLTMDRLMSDPTLGIVTCEGLPLGIASKSFTKQAMVDVYRHYKTDRNDTGFIYFFTKTNLCKQDVVRPENNKHSMPEARLTLDYPEDFDFFNKVFTSLFEKDKIFHIDEVLDLLREKPELLAINSGLNQKYWERTKEKANLEYVDSEKHIKKIPL